MNYFQSIQQEFADTKMRMQNKISELEQDLAFKTDIVATLTSQLKTLAKESQVVSSTL